MLVEAGLPISTAIGFRDKYLDSLHSMEDDAGRIKKQTLIRNSRQSRILLLKNLG